jgi:hypothetical protein
MKKQHNKDSSSNHTTPVKPVTTTGQTDPTWATQTDSQIT